MKQAIYSYGNTVYFCSEKTKSEGGDHTHKEWDCYIALPGAWATASKIAGVHAVAVYENSKKELVQCDGCLSIEESDVIPEGWLVINDPEDNSSMFCNDCSKDGNACANQA